MNQPLSYQELQERVTYLENRVRKISEDKANLYLVLHLVELLNPLAGLEELLQSLMSALCSCLGGTNAEIYYLDEGDIHYANLFGEHRVVERDVVLEDVGNSRLLENCLPRAFGLAGAAIDAFIGIDIELVGEFFLVGADVFINAIDRTHANASGVNAVAAKAGNRPGHS